MVKNENGGGGGGKPRVRRTRVQVLADLKAKMAKIEAQLAGNFDPAQDDTYMVTRLKRAIRSRDTATRVAVATLSGRDKTDNSPAVPPIDVKIANAQKRLADLETTKMRAIEAQARIPGDLETLNAALALAVKGEAVEFPTLGYILPTEKTEGEVEALASLGEQQPD